MNLNPLKARDEEIAALKQQNATLLKQLEILTKKHKEEIEMRTNERNQLNEELPQTQELLAQQSELLDIQANEAKMARHQVAGLQEQIAYIRRNLLSNTVNFAVLMAERKDYPSSTEWQVIYMERVGEAIKVKNVVILRDGKEETKEFLSLLNQCKNGAAIHALDNSALHDTCIVQAL